MINVLINNIRVIFLAVIAFIVIKSFLRKIRFEISWKWKNSWFGKFDLPDLPGQVMGVALICGGLTCLATLQQAYHFIDLGKEDNYVNLVIGILTLYGIFYTFIQFAIGYASQNEKDKHWGKSKTKMLLTDNIEYRLFLSNTFKVLLALCSVYPLLKATGNELSTIWVYVLGVMKIQEGFLVAFWVVSVFSIYTLYILLFVKSLLVMRRLFETQERDDYSSIRKIEYNTIETYQYYFLESYKKEKNYFLRLLIDDLDAAKEDEKKVMVKELLENSVRKYIEQQRVQISKIKHGKIIREKVADEYLDKGHYLVKFFEEFFKYISTGKIEFDFEELLSFYKMQDSVLYNQIYIFSSGKYEEIIDGIKLIYDRDGRFWDHCTETLYFRVPDLVWNRVNTYKNLEKLNHYMLKRESSRELLEKYYDDSETTYTKDEEKLLDDYNDYLNRVIDKCRDFQDNFKKDKNLELFKSWNYDKGERKISPVIQDRIYHYIEELEYNESNKQYFKTLISKLEYKYALAIIFYIMLYTGSDSYSKWKNDVLFLRGINSNFFNYNKINTDENINFVCSTIKNSQRIGHRISRELITWIMNHMESNLTTSIIQECNNQDYMSYARFLKFKYILRRYEYRHFFPDFSEIDLGSLNGERWNDWRVAYLQEMLETPELLKEEFFSGHQYRFSEQVLKSCLYDYVRESEDFRLFYIDMRFSINEDQFVNMIKEYSHLRKGIVDFLILKLDDESYEYLLLNKELAYIFIKDVKYNINQSNKSIISYVDELVNKANECSDNTVPIVTKNRIIIKLQKLIYGDYNKSVIE